MRAGECLGEGVLLEDRCHTATAVALGPVEAGVLPRDELIELLPRTAIIRRLLSHFARPDPLSLVSHSGARCAVSPGGGP